MANQAYHSAPALPKDVKHLRDVAERLERTLNLLLSFAREKLDDRSDLDQTTIIQTIDEACDDVMSVRHQAGMILKQLDHQAPSMCGGVS